LVGVEKFVGSVHWMGAPDSSLLDLIDKIRSWWPWSRTELSSLSTPQFAMANSSCSRCELKFTELCHKYSCQGCRRLLCGSCVRTNGSLQSFFFWFVEIQDFIIMCCASVSSALFCPVYSPPL